MSFTLCKWILIHLHSAATRVHLRTHAAEPSRATGLGQPKTIYARLDPAQKKQKNKRKVEKNKKICMYEQK